MATRDVSERDTFAQRFHRDRVVFRTSARIGTKTTHTAAAEGKFALLTQEIVPDVSWSHASVVALGRGQRKGISIMKRIKGNVVYAAIWMTGIISFVLASGAGHKFYP